MTKRSEPTKYKEDEKALTKVKEMKKGRKEERKRRECEKEDVMRWLEEEHITNSNGSEIQSKRGIKLTGNQNLNQDNKLYSKARTLYMCVYDLALVFNDGLTSFSFLFLFLFLPL